MDTTREAIKAQIDSVERVWKYEEQITACEKQIREAEYKIRQLKRDMILDENKLSWLNEGVYLAYQPSSEACTTHYIKVKSTNSSSVLADEEDGDPKSDQSEREVQLNIIGVGFTVFRTKACDTTVIENNRMTAYVPIKDIPRLKQITQEEWCQRIEVIKKKMDIILLGDGNGERV